MTDRGPAVADNFSTLACGRTLREAANWALCRLRFGRFLVITCGIRAMMPPVFWREGVSHVCGQLKARQLVQFGASRHELTTCATLFNAHRDVYLAGPPRPREKDR
jgi:hypothetical protein